MQDIRQSLSDRKLIPSRVSAHIKLFETRPGDFVASIVPREGDEIEVHVTHSFATDRQDCLAWLFFKKEIKLATRLMNCLNSGRGIQGFEVMQDTSRRTYILAETTDFFHGRYMNSSLKALGF
jgi:hypothetical protein